MYYFIDKIEAAIITWAVLEARSPKRIVRKRKTKAGTHLVMDITS